MYDERMVEPMRQELSRLGFEETRTPEAVDAVLAEGKGSVLVVVNSVCGCAAGNARPAIALAVQNATKPERMITVFAGNDKEATDKARSYFKGYRPSSPSIALLRDGQVVKMLERYQIEGRPAEQIADELKAAFDQYCVEQQTASQA